MIRKEERIISSHRQRLFIGFILLVLLCFWTIAWINPIVYSSSGPFSPKDFSDPTDLKPTFIPTPQEPLSNGSSDAGTIEIPILNHEPSSPSTWELVQRSLGEVITITWDTLAAGGRMGWTMGTEWLQTQVIQPTTYQLHVLSQGEVTSSAYWQAFFQLTLSLGIVGVGALLSWGMVGRQALFSSIGAMTAGGRMLPWLSQLLYGFYGGAGFWASIRSATGSSRMGPVLAKLRLHPFLRILAVPTRTVVQGGEAIGGGITRFLGSTWRTFHTSRLFTLISGSPGSTRLSQLMRGLQAVGSSFGRGASRLGTGFTSVASGLRRIRPWTGWSSWGTALTNTANQLREGLALRFWKERGWGRGKPASTHGPQRGGGYASAQWTPTVGRNPGMKPQTLGKSCVTAAGVSFHTVSSVLPDPDYSSSVDPQLLALLERYNQEDSQEKALISSLKLYLSQLGLLHGEEYIEGQGYRDQYTPELYNAIKDLQLLLNVFGDDLLLREEGRYHLEVNGEMDQDLVDRARTLASQGYPLGDWLTLLQDPDYQAEKWQAYEAYLQANGWNVLQIKEFLRITGFLQVEGELTAHYDLDTHAALLRFLQAHNEESSFGEMVQWDGISLIPLVLLEHLKKKGAGNRLYYGKHKKGIWDFIVGFMLGFTKGAVSLTAGFAIFAGGTLKFLFNMVFRPFKTGKEAFEALCRIPGAIVNLFKAIKVAYQEKVINGNLFTMGEFFGWATFEGTAIVIPIGIAKELSLLARFENWLIRLRLPQKGILGLLTHGTRNVAVYAVRGMRMVEQKINQGIRFVVLRVTILLRTMWGKIKGNFERVTEYLRNLASSIAQKRGKYTNAYIEANFKSFVSEIDAHLAETGLSKEEFISLIHKNVEDLTEAEIAILQQVRESISMPNEETLMQKVITIDQLEKYLTGEVDLEIGGYVSRAQDVIDLKTYDNIREGLRLDYTFDGGFSPFPEGGNEYAIIRFKTDTVIEIPRTKEFNGNEKIWSNEYGRQPFTGNGFTKSNDTIIPEFILSDKKAPIEAEFYKIIDGELNLVATYSDGEFILIK